MINQDRIKQLNTHTLQKGKFVIYWMEQSKRTIDNHALEYAVTQANSIKQPLFVFFYLTPAVKGLSYRNKIFLFEGLKETRKNLSDRRIPMIIEESNPDDLINISEKASIIITDCSYLNEVRLTKKSIADRVKCSMVQVESDVIVPVEIAYHKEAYSAAVIRRSITNLIYFHTQPVDIIDLKYPVNEHEFNSDYDFTILENIGVKQPENPITGGTDAALHKLERFLDEDLDLFDEERNNPGKVNSSGMSPYLHFGQISPLTIFQKVINIKSPGKERFLEELIVRRELAMNFTFYNPLYMKFESLPEWCRKTLFNHSIDRRDYVYSVKELEEGKTHDIYWNAAQQELLKRGVMHGYMRMYWGKKILEWMNSPEESFSTALFLNNKYSYDGSDPCSYAGIAWCFGKHDRPWKERAVFGSIRYMNDKGLLRKFDMEKYLDRINSY